jgi:O-antigen/teichoic acid export membrane protein/O-antigen ligase
MLFVIFGLLLLLVILSCTISPSPLFALGLITAFAFAAFAVQRPYFALLLVFVAAGLPALRPPLLGQAIHLIEPSLLLCLFAIIRWHPNLRLRLPHFLALLFVAIAIISFLHAPEISTPVVYGADKRLLVIIVMFFAFFCGAFLVKYIKDASSFLCTVLLCNIPLYLIGLAQALNIHVPHLLEDSKAQDPSQSLGRLWGPFPWPSVFGMYLINLFAIALACWILGTQRRFQIIGAIATIATALGIVGSGTRSAVIAAVAITFVMIVVTRRYKILFGMLMVAGVTIAVTFDKILPRFIHDPSSIPNRFLLWNEAIKIILTHPWIGVGLSHFRFYYTQLIVSTSSQLNPNTVVPHQQYLEWAVESGIGALIVGVLLLFSILYSCWQAYRIAPRRQQVLLLATILVVLGNMLIGFVDVPLDQVEAPVFLFLLIGLAVGYAEQIRWGVNVEDMKAPHTPWLRLLVMHITGAGRRLCHSLSKWRVAELSPSSQSSTIDAGAASTNDAAPNAQKTSRIIFIQMLSWGIAIPIIFPTTALLTRYLGPVRYGEYMFTLPFIAIFALLTGTGMDPRIIRQLSRKPSTEWSNILSYAAGTRLLSTTLSATALVLLTLTLPVSTEQRNLLLLGSISLFFSFSVNCLRAIYSHGFRAEQRASTLILLETTNRIVTAGLIALAVVLHLSLLWVYILIIYSDLPFFLIQMLIARRRFGIRVHFSLARAREHLLASLSLTGYDALTLIAGQADVILLMILAGSLSVGIYALAMRVTDPLMAIVFAYTNGFYPLLCAKFVEGREQFDRVYQEAVRILALITIPLAIFISTSASAIVALLGGQNFASAAIVVQLLIWALATTFFCQLAARACMATNMEHRIPYITAISVGINIFLNLVLIPRWLFVGAGIAALTSELSAMVLFYILLRHHVRLLPILWVVLRVFLANLPALAFLIWLQNAPLLLIEPVALLLTIIGYLVTGVLSLNDMFMAHRFLLTWRTRNKELSKGDTSGSKTTRPWPQNTTDGPPVALHKFIN